MAHTYDGTFATTPGQDGAKKVSYPLATAGGYDAQLIERQMLCAASAFASVVSARYVYTVGTRSVSTPTTDPGNSSAFLVEESEPDEGQLALGLARWRRIYATIPASVILPSTFAVSRPQIPGNGTFPRQYSDYIIDQPDTTVEAFDIYAKKTVTSDSGVPSYYPVAGNYQLVFAGYTSSTLAYSATALQVEAALDALTSVVSRGGCGVTGTYNSASGFVVTFANYADSLALEVSGIICSPPGSASTTTAYLNGGYRQHAWIFAPSGTVFSGGSFTASIFSQTTQTIAYNATEAQIEAALETLSEVQKRGGCSVSHYRDGTQIQIAVFFSNPTISGIDGLTPATDISVTKTDVDNTGKGQTIKLMASSSIRTVFAQAHGITGGSSVFAYAAPTYFTAITNYTVVDENLVNLVPRASDSWAIATTITQIGGLTKENYTPGTKRVRCTKTTAYYLPGYTEGISTAADIPIPTDQSSDADLLAAIFSAEQSINVSVSELEPYHFPILQRTVVTVAAADL
jgi:hypothetical protein